MKVRLGISVALVATALCVQSLEAAIVTVNSSSFDFVRRYGAGSAVVGDSALISVYSLSGDTAGAQQTFFKFSAALNAALTSSLGAGPYTINSATLSFSTDSSGTTTLSPPTIYLSSTSLAVTTGATKTTYNGSTAYPASGLPGTTASYGDYLSGVTNISLNNSGVGTANITSYISSLVGGSPNNVLFLTASPAANGSGSTVNNGDLPGANWNSNRYWSVAGNAVVLTVDAVAVPEPGSFSLLAFTTFGLIAWRRARHR